MTTPDTIGTTTIDGTTYFACGASGWCRTATEAQERATRIRDGLPHTESPRGCPSLLDLRTARKVAKAITLRDGGATLRAIEAAIKAGPGTVEAWRALDAVTWAVSMRTSPMSPVREWPRGEQLASWPHERA